MVEVTAVSPPLFASIPPPSSSPPIHFSAPLSPPPSPLLYILPSPRLSSYILPPSLLSSPNFPSSYSLISSPPPFPLYQPPLLPFTPLLPSLLPPIPFSLSSLLHPSLLPHSHPSYFPPSTPIPFFSPPSTSPSITTATLLPRVDRLSTAAHFCFTSV